jgi:hypothetical protein
MRREMKKPKRETRMYNSAKPQGKQKKQVAPSRSVSEAHGRVFFDGPIIKEKAAEKVVKGWTGSPKKTKGMVVITSVRMESE